MATVNRPKKVILHCSASPNYKQLTVEQIDKMHRARGWSQVGYHWIVYPNGELMPGRAERVVGAHTKGKNTHSLGICLIGTDRFTEEQVEGLIELYDDFYKRYDIDYDAWWGHYQFANKICPGIDMNFVRKILEQRSLMRGAVNALS